MAEFTSEAALPVDFVIKPDFSIEEEPSVEIFEIGESEKLTRQSIAKTGVIGKGRPIPVGRAAIPGPYDRWCIRYRSEK